MAQNNNVKIEGKSFERIRELVAAKKTACKEASAIAEKAHDQLWNAIHEEFPEIEKDAQLTLDVEYEKLGFYVVKDSDSGGLGGLLKAIAMKASLKD